MKKEKPIVVYGAIAANFVIAVAKYIVSFITGSSAMLSEALHSTADTGNELLLLFGLHQSRKPPDEMHPVGHGRELYFWSLIVAILLFGLGAGMSFYEGITSLIHPTELKSPVWNYVVLGVAFVAESVSWTLAIRKLLSRKEKDESFWQTLRRSKDPSAFVVFGEDTAALAGLLVAFLGVFLGEQLQSHYPDAIASLVIGLILAVVATFLAYESKSLLIGETADLELLKDVEQMVRKHPAVEDLRRPVAVQLGVDHIFLALDVEFKSELSAARLVQAVDDIESSIRTEHESVREIFIETEGIRQAADKSHT